MPQILSRGPGRRETSTELSPWALRNDRSTVHKGEKEHLLLGDRQQEGGWVGRTGSRGMREGCC